MPLDLNKVFPQVGGMIRRLKIEGVERQERLKFALGTLREQAGNAEKLAGKINASKTTWLVSGLVDGLDRVYSPAAAPDEFSVLATDGSHIAVDRHRSPRCYLINIGTVALHYGRDPGAELDSVPSLYSGEEEMFIAPDGAKGREQPVEGTLLGIKRGIDECCHLVRLAADLPERRPCLALVDGSLILWQLENFPEFVIEALLNKGFLSYLTEIESLNKRGGRLALASYISFPRSTEVVNALRVALCPHEILDTDYHCPECEAKACEAVAGICDRELFIDILKPGERSAIFTSGSSIVKKRYGGHGIYFFYVRVEDEIARVEIPQWAALNEDLLNLTHSLTLDQCHRGHGYPVALSESHEQAVVTGADRENFWQMIEASLVDEHLPCLSSAKSRSKRTRWV